MERILRGFEYDDDDDDFSIDDDDDDYRGLQDLMLYMDELPKERPPQIARRRLMRSYFDKGRDYSQRSRKPMPPHSDPNKTLHEACAAGDFETLRGLIESGISDVNELSPAGFTALAVACVCGREEFAKYLLEEGAAFSLPNHKGATPLHLASRGGHLKVVELLLKAGALAVMHRKDTHGATAFMEAVLMGHLSTMRVLRNHGAYVNDQRNDGVTPLHLAAERGDRDVVSFLCQEGSEPDARNDLGETPLFAAASEGHFEAVQLLLLHGAKKDSVSHEELTPFDVAEDPIIEGVLLSSPYAVPTLKNMCISLIRGNQRTFSLPDLENVLPQELFQAIRHNY